MNQDKDHCYNCHQFGHFAADCPEQIDLDEGCSLGHQSFTVSNDPLSDTDSPTQYEPQIVAVYENVYVPET